MAKIVCIKAETEKPGFNSIGDIVSIHDNDVELTGSGYANFEVIIVKGLTKKEVQDQLKSTHPETKTVDKFVIDPDEVTVNQFVHYWKNPVDAKFYQIKAIPKNPYTAKNITTQDKIDLSSQLTAKSAKLTIISKAESNISLNPENTKTVEPKEIGK